MSLVWLLFEQFFGRLPSHIENDYSLILKDRRVLKNVAGKRGLMNWGYN